MKSEQDGIGRAIRKALVIAGAAIALFAALSHLLLPWYSRLGTAGDERDMTLPGDGIVPNPTTGYTLGITIQAMPEEVWPWLAQMGQGRAGFYTHTWLENLLGADIHNADQIIPSLQNLTVGDTVRLTPDPYFGQPGQFMIVAEASPSRFLVFRQRLPSGGVSTWAFVVVPRDPTGTRLLMRRRGVEPSLFDRLMMPGYVFMDRGVLRGIRDRAEAQ